MQEKIDKLIDNITRSLEWLKVNKGEQFESRSLDLIEERRRLGKLKKALGEKPAVAAFGESQKGKSYLIGNLLQKDKRPFTVRSGETGEEVNFVASVNPIGNKREATGVVTRFTSFAPGSNRYSVQYPVIIKLLSPAELATILADGYVNDLSDFRSYSMEELKTIASGIIARYSTQPVQSMPVITVDEVLDIKQYLATFAQSATTNLRTSGYFEAVATVASRIPEADLPEVLKYLWHENPVLTALFSRLLGTLRRLGHRKEVYASLESVRHYGDNKNTCMSVDCLNELDLPQPQRMMDIMLRQSDGSMVKVADVPKCEISALCAETVYRIDERYLSDVEEYFQAPAGEGGAMQPESVRKLGTSVTKDLLREVDLLDFPGARSRLKLMEDFLSNMDEDAGASNSVQMLLRGKVAFLFNSYNENRAINILLLCHDHENPSVSDMYIMINSWVERYVGKTPEARKNTVNQYGGISPLFLVGTKFNIDMMESKQQEENNEQALHQRWEGRFEKVVHRQVIKGSDMQWFGSWVTPGETFKNTYLLRDFKFSDCSSSGNNLYEGYDETAAVPSEQRMRLTPDFYNRLRQTFTGNEWVRKFFADPALAWDVAATRNNDGALYIIDNLTRASHSAVPARLESMRKEIGEAAAKVKASLEGFYVDEDADRLLTDNIRKAAAIMREIDFTTNTDNYFFGHLMQALMMSESESLSIVHRLIQSPELVSTTTDWKEYELIRKRCSNFDGCTTPEQKWQRLIDVYFFRDREDAERYLQRRDVDPRMLFSGEFKKKNNSTAIVDAVLDEWHAKISGGDFRNLFTANSGFDPAVLADLIDNIRLVSRRCGLAEDMEQSIAEYVNIVNVANANENLVADLLASKINTFVADLGASTLSDAEMENARKISQSQNLRIFDYMERERKSEYSEEEMAALFDALHDNTESMTPSFDAQYYTWLEYVMLSFIAKVEVPDYNHEANDQLGKILEEL